MMEIRHLSALLICGYLSLGTVATTSSSAAENATLSSSASSMSDDLAPVTMMDTGSFHAVVIIRDNMANVVKNWGANGKGQVRETERPMLPHFWGARRQHGRALKRSPLQLPSQSPKCVASFSKGFRKR